MQVSATLLPFSPLPFRSRPPHRLPFPCSSAALLLLCVVDTSWHVAKSPGHLTALLSCPLHSGTDDSLVARGPFVASLSLQQVPYSERQEPASPRRFVSAARPFDVLISSTGDGSQGGC
ncbi:hypothetical protein GBF38_007523 [Nibea albiflora]|uniref:Uncharacterized protein n=1 Tax=Nibea albiflora TaxID=240163 RepID=A0ACB7ELQ4_NIBAL|nr:hypothetical protein GBF38_007523 [Nibea albiflora]